MAQCNPCLSSHTKVWRKKYLGREHALRLRRIYGLRLGGYEEMLAEQGGGCAICGGRPSAQRKHLDVDHDHHTGEIRSLLCNRCNRAVAALNDDMIYAVKVISYIRKKIGIKENGLLLYERDGK
jgi:hypothetical protein